MSGEFLLNLMMRDQALQDARDILAAGSATTEQVEKAARLLAFAERQYQAGVRNTLPPEDLADIPEQFDRVSRLKIVEEGEAE